MMFTMRPDGDTALIGTQDEFDRLDDAEDEELSDWWRPGYVLTIILFAALGIWAVLAYVVCIWAP